MKSLFEYERSVRHIAEHLFYKQVEKEAIEEVLENYDDVSLRYWTDCQIWQLRKEVLILLSRDFPSYQWEDEFIQILVEDYIWQCFEYLFYVAGQEMKLQRMERESRCDDGA